METFVLSDQRYVMVDGDKAVVFDRKDLEAELVDVNKRLLTIPKLPLDAELLAWAKENYPTSNMDYSVEVRELTSRKEKLKTLIESAKAVEK